MKLSPAFFSPIPCHLFMPQTCQLGLPKPSEMSSVQTSMSPEIGQLPKQAKSISFGGGGRCTNIIHHIQTYCDQHQHKINAMPLWNVNHAAISEKPAVVVDQWSPAIYRATEACLTASTQVPRRVQWQVPAGSRCAVHPHLTCHLIFTNIFFCFSMSEL